MRQITAAVMAVLLYAMPVLAQPRLAQPAVASSEQQKHILFLANENFTQPYVRLTVEAFTETLFADPSAPVLFLESLDAARFQKGDYLDNVRQWFRTKYATTRIDLIVTYGEEVAGFLAGGPLWPDTPVLYFEVGYIDEKIRAALPLASGLLLEDAFEADLGVIKQILPETKHVALVYGGSEVERERFRTFADKVRDSGFGLDPILLIGVPASGLVQRLNDLPADTIAMFLAPLVDMHGQPLSSDRPCELLETSANKPAFTQGYQDLGCGVVGGLLRDWSKVGRQIGLRSLAILKNGPNDVQTVPIADYTTLAFDARQLERWGISESRLPAGSLVVFRTPSLWRDHPNQVIGGVMIGILQTAIIVALLAEHRRRRRAEVQARQHLVAMAHLDRRAAMGELATSLAHEINQPLNAILHNAGAARMMVDADGHGAIGELGEILDDIRKDDLRAAEIIKRMRSLLKKHELERLPIDVKDLALDTIKLAEHDAASRGITLDFDLRDGLRPVLGDRVHLQQVLLNLMMNGMDAVTSAPPDRRRVFVRTMEQGAHVGLAVHDTGPGIPQDCLAQIFEPFFTTKGEGMGMGLAIARSIIEAHDGRIVAENNANGGATVWFSVPSAGEPISNAI